MKCEQDNQGFRPITITLETEEEAQVLKNILLFTNGRDADSFAYKLWVELDKSNIKDVEYFTIIEDMLYSKGAL